MFQLLAIHLRQVASAFTERLRGRSRDRGALNTLELVILSLGFVAIAALFVAFMRQFVSGHLDQLK